VVAKTYSDNPEMRNLEREINYLRDMLKMRGGKLPTDIELREKYKQLQHENDKLKEMVDQNMLERLKRENLTLKQQLQNQQNDVLSDSFINLKPPYKTLDHPRSEEPLHSVASQGNTAKFSKNNRKEETRSLAARTDDASSNQGSTYHRGTGFSMFPPVSKSGGKATSKILDRIMEIERAKQENRVRL
jgi:hypothetical protein